MPSPRGSLWNKWDLHVHTPESLVHQYPGDKEQAWAAFLDDLERLPECFKVLGINDYIFLDGYRRILQEKDAGRLRNIELILPVVELRLAAFAGANEHLKRVNFHVLFSDDLTPDVIQAQFLNALTPHYQLSPIYADVSQRWAGVPDRDGLETLGRAIIDSVPEARRGEFRAPLIEGFNNFNLDLRHILDVLDRPQFEGLVLKGVGKTEWDAIQWADNTIADKRQIINSADFVFVASQTPAAWTRARNALEVGRVNSRLLDCSDAHHLSDSRDKDRIGNCWTWIKADPTFEGLRHALNEFEQRVFIGEEPELLMQRRTHGSRFVDQISIHRVVGSTLPETWFDVEVPINPGVVAIIGNKGTGKSALAEAIGVVGNTRQQEFFSFLSPYKFRQRSTQKAAHFEATVNWVNNTSSTKRLDEQPDPASPESVQFIPQNFLEKVCNEVPGGEERDFDRELKRVIFSHVGEPDRLGQASLDELLEFKSRARQTTIAGLRDELHKVNGEIVKIEERLSDGSRRTLRTQTSVVIEKLRDLDRSRPEPIQEPTHTPESEAISGAVHVAQGNYETALREVEQKSGALSEVNRTAAELDHFGGRIESLVRDFDVVTTEFSGLLAAQGLSMGDILILRVDRDRLAGLAEGFRLRQNTLRAEIEAARAHVEEHRLERDRLQAQLNAPHQAYQSYLARVDEFNRAWETLIGSPEKPETLWYYRRLRREWGRLPALLAGLQNRRRELVTAIHNELTTLRAEYSQLYRPIQQFIEEQPINAEVGLSFAVELVDTDFEGTFLEFINRRLAGTFSGTQESEVVVREMLALHDLNTLEGALTFVDAIDRAMRSDPRVPQREVAPGTILRRGKLLEDVYDFVYSFTYLEPRYSLRFGEKDLYKLSPGEKGTLLLIFYLLVDKSDTPLVIDQPEDNLDNQTVYQVLVTCLRDARRRRQIFIVTHNPNLAVVCDADQVIVAQMEKDQGNRITYESGALENPTINRRVIDILEGTRPAFDNRRRKYL